jgi:hypothetical protein
MNPNQKISTEAIAAASRSATVFAGKHRINAMRRLNT